MKLTSKPKSNVKGTVDITDMDEEIIDAPKIRPTDSKVDGKRVAVWIFAGETTEECEYYLGRKLHVDFDCYSPIYFTYLFRP